MNDQANSLRKRMEAEQRGAGDARVISVVSGKGGVGKSNVTVNFALSLAELNKKVVVFDLDIGMANVDILLGETPRHSIVDMVENQLTIWDIIETGPQGLQFIAGGSGLSEMFSMNEAKRDRFLEQLEALTAHVDIILFDMGAGATADTMQFILAADEVLLVTTPEPTAITDAYGMFKWMHLENADLPCSLVVNRAQTEREGDQTAENVKTVAERFLSRTLAKAAVIPEDQAVMKAVRSQKPFVLHNPKSKASRAVINMAAAFAGKASNKNAPASFVSKLRTWLKPKGDVSS
ncbi:flagellar biosynthesis protein FlhG [Salsuginibacillus halophilus]|uniref:Flagellar biosynthesis protein FlhG n=1 Tax=Salsuginibacillus halophilus TaxID=517424 RepID=A0A2P8HYC7_9BACI|nr:MinD/ParA family protein [Salsuginibacillus halophilus]PSL51209.1 flagellar biosynthesis protein FlhG [Salsuginibacillus halophilus]